MHNKNINESKKSVSNLADQLSRISKEMKDLAGRYGRAKKAKAHKDMFKIISDLKGLTAQKKSLEKQIDNAIGDLDKDVELVQNEQILRSVIRNSVRESMGNDAINLR